MDEIKLHALIIVVTTEPYFDTLRTRHQYEKDLYWTHQLFVNQWTPGLPHIVDELPG